MKNSLLFLFVTILTAFLFSSCSKDNIDGTDVGNGSVTATIGANSFSASGDQVTFAEGNANGGGFGITATTSDGQVIDIAYGGMANSNTTYTTSADVLTFNYKPSNLSATNAYITAQGIGQGEIRLSTFNDNKVKGTFTFQGVKVDISGSMDTISVTSGSFDINR